MRGRAADHVAADAPYHHCADLAIHRRADEPACLQTEATLIEEKFRRE